MEETGEIKSVLVQLCARCGQDHRITFQGLLNPPDEYQWWGMCENTGQPVWLRIVESGEEAEPAGAAPLPGDDHAPA